MAETLSLPINSFKVAILGTGLYGRAIANRIRQCSQIETAVGSRSPSLKDGHVSHTEAVKNADVIILSVPVSAYSNLIQNIREHIPKDAVIVDIANRPLSKKFDEKTVSTIDHLRTLLPEHKHIVKAFNTISAYHIAPNSSTKAVPMVQFCADSNKASETISLLIRSMRMIPVYFGGLETALELEKSSHRIFPLWRTPICITAIIWIWWIAYSTLSMYILNGKDGSPYQKWESFPIFMFMASTGETAMTLFAITFLAGPIAILIQLMRRSTSKPFGMFLGSWLGMRKELGVLAFAFSCAHVLAGLVSDPKLTGGSKGQLYAVFGIISLMMFGILAVSSNKSVADDMSWAEFQVIFSYVGVTGLVFGILHQGFWGAQFLKQISNPRDWVGNGVLMPRYWLGIILPIVTVTLRFITWSPCILYPIRRLRGDNAQIVSNEKL